MSEGGDVISVTGLQLRTASLQPDLWLRPDKDQPLVCSLRVETTIHQEADADNLLAESLNYGSITKAIEAHVAQLPEGASLALEVLAERIARVVLFECHAPNVRLELERPRALLTAAAVGVSIRRTRDDYCDDPVSSARLKPTATNPDQDTLYIRQLERHIIIGLNPGERLDEQKVLVDLEFRHEPPTNDMTARPGWQGWRGAVKRVEQVSCALSLLSSLA